MNCTYCGGSFNPKIVPWTVKYSVEDLRKFIDGDHSPIIAFYGGEPLLNSDFIVEVMDEIDWAKYVIQTNGLLIDKLPSSYWRRFNTILLSIDGREEVTDHYRGKGVYRRVIEAAWKLKSIGFNGDLIARMTVSELSDIYVDVMHLLSLGLFDHIHWQLNVVWSCSWIDFNGWLEKSYLPGISRLIKFWVNSAHNGEVLGLVPFIGVLKYMLLNKPIESPPCGSGSSSIAISTDGRVLACPIAVEEKWAELGSIWGSSWKNYVNRIRIGEPCISCQYFRYCGGRCLYAYMEKLWGESGFRSICRATIHMINELLKVKNEIQNLISRGIIPIEELLYPQFNNTTEIIP